MAEGTRAEATFAASGLAYIPVRQLRFRMLSGSAIMLLSSVLVGGLNLIYNFVIAQRLGAVGFGHASVVYTLLMLLSSVTLSFQLLCSKYVARGKSSAEKFAVYRLLHHRAWLCGIALAALLALGSAVISDYLNLSSKTLVLLLACGVAFYVPLGVRRGFMEGFYDFRLLALNFSLEAVAKLVGATALMARYGVEGVVGGIAGSVIAAYLFGIPRKDRVSSVPETKLHAGMDEGIQAAIFFIGQVIINNLDIVLVKHFFSPATAGLYAAVALVGRVVYMLSWSVVSSMFPFSAGIRSERRSGTLLLTALGLVAAIASVFTLAAWLTPPALWQALLGKGFPLEQLQSYSSLLGLYALTAGVYGLSIVLMTYEISRKIGNASWMQLGLSGTIIVGIYLFHSNLQQVILVQLVLMLALVLIVSAPFIRKPVRRGSLDSGDKPDTRAQISSSVAAHAGDQQGWRIPLHATVPDISYRRESGNYRFVAVSEKGRDYFQNYTQLSDTSEIPPLAATWFIEALQSLGYQLKDESLN